MSLMNRRAKVWQEGIIITAGHKLTGGLVQEHIQPLLIPTGTLVRGKPTRPATQTGQLTGPFIYSRFVRIGEVPTMVKALTISKLKLQYKTPPAFIARHRHAKAFCNWRSCTCSKLAQAQMPS